MFSHVVFCTTSMLSIIVSAAMFDSDLSEAFEDDTLFPNTELPSNPSLISFNQPLSPTDPNLSLFDPAQVPDNSMSFSTGNSKDTSSDLLFGDTNDGIPIWRLSDYSNESNLFSDDSVKPADCSASESLSMIGKPRLRRRDEWKCTNPATTPQLTIPTLGLDSDIDSDLLGQFSQDPEKADLAREAAKNSDNNVSCYLFTNGQLPWGVCSSGLSSNAHRYGRNLYIGTKELTMWWLAPCTLGTLFLHN